MNYNLDELCVDVMALAKDAGDKIMQFYNDFDKDVEISIKQDSTPVTNADLASHKILCHKLHALTNNGQHLNLPILSEEDTEISNTARMQWDDYWLIDPLDGTKEFINKNGEFCINIALIHKHRPILGVLYAPFYDLFYYASYQNGAYKLEKNKQPCKIQTKNLSAADIMAIRKEGGELNIITSRRHNKLSRYNDFIKFLDDNNIKHNIILLGSALKFGYVADGQADIYARFGVTGEWDTAAGDCIVQEAGGGICAFDNKPLLYNTTEILLNPEFYAAGDINFNWQQLFNNYAN